MPSHQMSRHRGVRRNHARNSPSFRDIYHKKPKGNQIALLIYMAILYVRQDARIIAETYVREARVFCTKIVRERSAQLARAGHWSGCSLCCSRSRNAIPQYAHLRHAIKCLGNASGRASVRWQPSHSTSPSFACAFVQKCRLRARSWIGFDVHPSHLQLTKIRLSLHSPASQWLSST